jgi:hypothetical protein
MLREHPLVPNDDRYAADEKPKTLDCFRPFVSGWLGTVELIPKGRANHCDAPSLITHRPVAARW